MCVATFRSMTQAMKAKNYIDQLYISSKIKSIDSKMTKKGCAYGIEFNCINLSIITDCFYKNKVKYTNIFKVE